MKSLMNTIFSDGKHGESRDISEDELLNVQRPVYDAELLEHDYRCDSLEDDLYSVEEKVDSLVKAVRLIVQDPNIPFDVVSEITGDKKGRKALGVKAPKSPQGAQITLVLNHPSITINLADGQTSKGDDKK